ncbi:PREDICTED: uncharacterized protein LOC108370149 [Rhagoletis zephyria]|uniref:uncharacterized protein LOC108370149 n=1 Tax=Rhagoletis zephyria TaxID=28612 RepID=UPI0008115CC0|nr:PREDICTED: uncharacterized protein LOC108370149 [Rhagoletis zephyria]
MQNIWLEGTDWDEKVSRTTLDRWQTFTKNYNEINNIRIPRWVEFSPTEKIEIHGFCDSSEKAYAAAVHLRVEREKCIFVNLLFAKTRVAPVKTISLPRLELCGAVFLAETIESVINNLDLGHLQIHPCSWSTFVAHRITKKIDKVGNLNWRHVDSATNLADLASRGILAQELINNALWWQGPSWLQEDKEKWPTQETDFTTNIEEKSGGPIDAKSEILPLNPFIDKNGVLRTGGRLGASLDLAYNERYPIILPYNCRLSRLTVQFVQDVSLHGENQLMLRLIRTQYWIPKVKTMIRSIIYNCKICTIFKKRSQNQLMAILPQERTT